MRVAWKSVGLVVVPLVAVLLAAACGSSGNNGNTNTSSQSAANTSGVSTSIAASPTAVPASTIAPTSVASAPTSTVAVAASSTATGTILTEIATDNKFSQTTYTIKAGQQYTLNFQNSGQAIHDWHILDQKSAAGKDIAVPLTEGGKTSSVTFIIDKPGTYNFHCDVHPDEMKGTITVQP